MWRAASTLTFAAAAVAFTTLASPAAAAVTINYASIGNNSFVNVGAPDLDNALTDIQSLGGSGDSQLGSTDMSSELHTSVQNIKKGTLISSASMDQHADLKYISGNEWIFQTGGDSNMFISSPGNFALVSGGYTMSTRYSVDRASVLKVFYEIDQDFSTSGIVGAARLSFYNLNLPSTYIPTSGSGVLTFNMAAGTDYGVSLYGFPWNWGATKDVGSFSNSLSHKYRFLIVPASVPEPGTWAMMLVGFSALGIGLRRSRASARRLAH